MRDLQDVPLNSEEISLQKLKGKMRRRAFLHLHTTDFKSLPETNTSLAVMPGHDSSVGVPNV